MYPTSDQFFPLFAVSCVWPLLAMRPALTENDPPLQKELELAEWRKGLAIGSAVLYQAWPARVIGTRGLEVTIQELYVCDNKKVDITDLEMPTDKDSDDMERIDTFHANLKDGDTAVSKGKAGRLVNSHGDQTLFEFSNGDFAGATDEQGRKHRKIGGARFICKRSLRSAESGLGEIMIAQDVKHLGWIVDQLRSGCNANSSTCPQVKDELYSDLNSIYDAYFTRPGTPDYPNEVQRLFGEADDLTLILMRVLEVTCDLDKRWKKKNALKVIKHIILSIPTLHELLENLEALKDCQMAVKSPLSHQETIKQLRRTKRENLNAVFENELLNKKLARSITEHTEATEGLVKEKENALKAKSAAEEEKVQAENEKILAEKEKENAVRAKNAAEEEKAQAVKDKTEAEEKMRIAAHDKMVADDLTQEAFERMKTATLKLIEADAKNQNLERLQEDVADHEREATEERKKAQEAQLEAEKEKLKAQVESGVATEKEEEAKENWDRVVALSGALMAALVPICIQVGRLLVDMGKSEDS